jgi:hypothetical protein
VPGTPAPPDPAPAVEVPEGVVAAEDEPEDAPEPVLLDDDDEAPLVPALVVGVLEVVAVDVVSAGGALSVGMVSVGTPDVSAWVEAPPPQAETPTASATPAENAARELVRLVRRGDISAELGLERVHATPAMWAIVEILLGELVTPIAETEVLDRPGQLRGRRGKRKQHCHHFERLLGLPVHIRASRHGLDYYLAAR